MSIGKPPRMGLPGPYGRCMFAGIAFTPLSGHVCVGLSLDSVLSP